MSDFSDTIRRFGREYEVERAAASSEVKGRPVAGAVSVVKVVAVIGPAEGKVLKRFPEGTRLEGLIQVVTSDRLYLAGEGGSAGGDVVRYLSGRYQVERANDWQELGNFFQFFAQKIGRL